MHKTTCDRHTKYVAGCEGCQERKAAYMRSRKTRGERKVYGPDEIKHGIGGYQYHRCGCQVCLDANRERYRRHRKRQAEQRWKNRVAEMPTQYVQVPHRMVKSAAEILRGVPARYL